MSGEARISSLDLWLRNNESMSTSIIFMKSFVVSPSFYGVPAN